MKKIVIVITVSFIVSALGYLAYQGFIKERFFGKSALSINSLDDALTVTVGGESVGSTPYSSETLSGESVDVTLSKGSFFYSTSIPLLSSTRTIINWGLGPSEAFSFGEQVWLEVSKSGSALVVISSPSSARVKVDGVLAGVTPFSTSELSLGEHTVSVEKDGYQGRKVRVNLQEDYKLNVKIQLLLEPFTSKQATLLSDYTNPAVELYDLSTKDAILYSDLAGWALGLGYWLGEGGGGEDTLVCDYYVDFNGGVYDSDGVAVTDGFEGKEGVDNLKVGYLGKGESGLTEKATASLDSLAEALLTSVIKLKILPTGTGWLRARSQPGLGGEELAKLDVGSTYVSVEQDGGWYAVKLEDGRIAWVLGQYVEELL